jgi:diguanylate cyclase (GGDEF)-like protein/PAS domain S-box-containing protein
MSIDGQTDHAADALWAAEGLEARLDPLSLWRVATWEYDRSTDFVCWFDSPVDVLNLSDASGDALIDPIVVSLRSGAPFEHYDLERTLEDRDGEPVDLRIRARCLRDESGRISGGIGLVTDVSEQRRNEGALRGVIDRYRRLVELSPDPVVVHQDGIIRYASPAALTVAGVQDSSDLVGHAILDFVHPSSLEDTLERIAMLTEPGMVSEPAEAVLVSQTGDPVVVESISVLIDWDGAPAFQVILRDISERRRAEAALRYQASLVSHVSDAIIATDRAGRIRSWNPAAEALYGVRSVEAIGRPAADLLGANAIDADGMPRPGELDHVRADAQRIPVLVSVAPVRDEVGESLGTVAVCTDLTERLERKAAEARYRAAVAALDEGVLVVDHDGTIVSANASARAMLGADVREGVNSRAAFGRPMVAEDGTPMSPDEHPLAVGLRTGRPQSRVVLGFRDHEDALRWFSVSVQPLRHEHAERAGALVCSFSEITDRRQVEAQLSFQATHDPLTRLPNRDLVLSAITDALGEGDPGSAAVAVLLIDLDQFKRVNDTFGHGTGDSVLKVVAGRISGTCGARDLLGRLAGDEFVMVCPGVDRPEQAREVARRVAEAVSAPLRLPSGRELVVTISIGIASIKTGQGTPEVALSHADVAMYRAKELGRDRIEVFDDELRSVVSRRLLIHEGLRGAVDAREITAHYQPIVHATTGEVVGVEGLARWEHHTLGEISPAEFIPIAEDTGLAVPLGAHILQVACAELARWQRTRRVSDDFTLNVNLSPRQLADPELPATVARILDATGVDAGHLWLEVTESVLMEDAAFISTALADLRAFGVHFAIDDFGTGYSSLAYLKRFPVEALKVDKSFVDGLGRDPESDAIVAAIVGLAQSLHLRTIAEGVETPEQLTRLRELGCELIQGFLFSEPIPGPRVQFSGSTARLAAGGGSRR